MKILQISVGFPYSSIYKNMYLELNNKNIDFEVYVPRHYNTKEKKINTFNYPYKIYTNNIIKKWDKYLYFSKIYKMRNDVINYYNLTKINLIHAHSIFSDGAVAYEIFKQYNIPYIVAVRDTDMNQYFKKAKHLKLYAIKILKNANKIIFLSEGYKNKLINDTIPQQYVDKFDEKSIIIPNGVNEFWLNNIYLDKQKFDYKRKELNLIYVGKIIKRKNLKTIIESRSKIEDKTNMKVNIYVIGEKIDINYFNQIQMLGKFTFVNHCSQEELLKYYRKSDIFIMPSLTETFGLVYGEAMSQGLPVIYTKEEGFDGQFKNGLVGYRVAPTDIEEISERVNDILNNYDNISKKCLQYAPIFNWNKITDKYKKIYKEIHLETVNQ